MQVAQYTYRSPSPDAVQVGKLDPNSVKENAINTTEVPKIPNETQEKAQNFQATQTKEVTPTLTPDSIDLYV
ncbi:MAG: hypothetical protein RBR59_04035 [Sulfurimonadaceae bacterium]|jgi:hypothetical protein|nr:hypothetical protein [Sulfurimonadaceae bacterium]